MKDFETFVGKAQEEAVSIALWFMYRLSSQTFWIQISAPYLLPVWLFKLFKLIRAHVSSPVNQDWHWHLTGMHSAERCVWHIANT